METTGIDTVIVTTCRCGWLGVAATFEGVTEMFAIHRIEDADNNHDGNKQRFIASANPLPESEATHLRREAVFYSSNSRAAYFQLKAKRLAPEGNRLGPMYGLRNAALVCVGLAALAMSAALLWYSRAVR